MAGDSSFAGQTRHFQRLEKKYDGRPARPANAELVLVAGKERSDVVSSMGIPIESAGDREHGRDTHATFWVRHISER
jgi:hypothetical protein